VQVTALGTNVADVAVSGRSSSCARKTDGTLWCWGENGDGAVGDGTIQNRPLPVQVASLGAGVAQVSMGESHTCARRTDGTVWCWGRNAEGELGDGTTMNSSAPLQVAAVGTNAIQIAAGGHRTYARKVDGTFWCWGSGWFGDGPAHLFPSGPVQVATLGPSVADVSVGGGHACSRKIDGTLWCWGQNDYGGLGDGTTENRGTPVQVTGVGTSVAQVSASDVYGLTCARKLDGTVWCWGDNTSGNVGDGTTAGVRCAQDPDGGVSGWCRLMPMQVVGLCR
jgi:alpha-tubulin suppressor-like RCC1 family protein